MTVGVDGNEPLIKVAPDGTLYISALEYPYVSTDGGRSWFRSPGTIYSDPAFNQGVNFNTDSSIDVDPNAGCTSRSTIRTQASRQCARATTTRSTSPATEDRPPEDRPDVARRAVDEEGFPRDERGAVPDAVLHQFRPRRELVALRDRGFHPRSEHRTARPLAQRQGRLPGKDSQGNPTGKDVLVARSTDGGKTWKVLPRLPGTTTGTAAFSVVASAGNGHIGVLYYRTPTGGRADTVNGTWSVVWAETFDANATIPRWNVRTIETGVHRGPICTTAGCVGDARFAGDFIGAAFDAQGRPHLTWVRDLGKGNTEIRYAGPGS